MLYSLLLFFLFSSFAPPPIFDQLLKGSLEVDLIDPVVQQGKLTTEKGGIVKAPSLRIQAKIFEVGIKPSPYVLAEGQLLVEYGDYAFVGEKIFYDFEAKRGTIYLGKIGIEPWFFGAKQIELLPDGTYVFQEASITTNEEQTPEWVFQACLATLKDNRYLLAQSVTFRLFDLPVFWLPWIRADLKTWLDNPIKYRFRWGGEQGPRFGLIYEVWSWNHLKIFARFDYRLNRGPGGGFESRYQSKDKKQFLQTINYIARDNSIENPNQRTRYRFQGILGYQSLSNCSTLHLSYDKLSDKEMATDYHEKGLELKTGKKTEGNLRHIEPWGIHNLFARLKINDFQTVKQELPSLSATFYPLDFKKGPLYFENNFKLGYLDFEYADFLPDVTDYHSARGYLAPKVYTPLQMGPLQVTPSALAIAVVYSNSPGAGFRALWMGGSDVLATLRLTKNYTQAKHTLIPYLHYSYFTKPTVNADQHYIFDIQDGLSHLNLMKVGAKQLIYFNPNTFFPSRHLNLDLFALLFFDTPTINYLVPKMYGDLLWDTSPTLRQTVQTAWDFQHGQLDHFNYKLDWTIFRELAFSFEYRKRSRYAWRKSDHHNFFLDTFRSIASLLHSPVSDRRDTLLFHTYFRFLPNWAFHFYIRHGWHRLTEPHYTEWEVDVTTVLRSIWHTKFSYQKKMDDHRFAFYFTLSLDKPKVCPY